MIMVLRRHKGTRKSEKKPILYSIGLIAQLGLVLGRPVQVYNAFAHDILVSNYVKTIGAGSGVTALPLRFARAFTAGIHSVRQCVARTLK